MADFKDNYDEIEFLDSEIVDDDADAPVGTLIINDGGKVRAAAENGVHTTDGGLSSADTPKEEPVGAENPEKADITADTPATAGDGRATSSEAEKTYDGETDASGQGIREEIPRNDTLGETTAQVAAEPYTAAETAPCGADAAEENAEAVLEPAAAPVSDDAASAAAEETAAPRSEIAAAAETKPQKTKPAAKKAASVTIQSAADGGDVWGKAVIKPVKKAKTKEKTEEEATDMAKDTAKNEKPAAKTAAAKEDKAQTKKIADKKTDKAETAKAANKKPAKTAPVKEEKAAKPSVRKADAAEQIIEAGDDSAPHGKFVIKKTDKGNFVYKLYSFNHRVVAIGAEQYSSLATCKAGVNSVKNNAENAPIEDQTLQKWEEKKCPKWQIYTDKKGEIRLRLLASNGYIVATTNDGYLSKDAAKKGIAAIARACKGADVVRNDTLW